MKVVIPARLPAGGAACWGCDRPSPGSPSPGAAGSAWQAARQHGGRRRSQEPYRRTGTGRIL